MGSSIAMIDYHYGHLAHDSLEHAVSLLDALAFERAVDAGWTPPPKSATPVSETVSRRRRSRSRRTWTLGGRRGRKSSPLQQTETGDLQGDRDAL
jgi:hypothetical protein